MDAILSIASNAPLRGGECLGLKMRPAIDQTPQASSRQRFARARPARVVATTVSALVMAAASGFAAAPASAAAPPTSFTSFVPGQIVGIPADIPHEPGAMVDRRIIPDLRYLAQIYPIFVWEGYAGPLKGVGEVGCRRCHVKHSDHYNGLGVDLVPLYWDGKGCDSSWRPISRLAHWAEPRQNHPRLPFRWVGYKGDVNHGCGNHLHLSWDHAHARPFTVARWVTLFDVPPLTVAAPPPSTTPVTPPVPPEGS